MSILTTTPLKSAPSGVDSIAITTGGSSWTWGSWTEMIASTATDIAIAGVQLYKGTYSAQTYDVDFGLGASGFEVSIGTLRVYLYNSGSRSTPTGAFLPLPMGGIAAGQRVSVRVRADGATAGPTRIALNYYEEFDATQVADIASNVLSAAPGGTTLANLTPSATPWANSAWVEMVAAAASDYGVLGVAHGPNETALSGVEFDIGTGGSGSETVITTLRTIASRNRLSYTWLPGILPIDSGTRVAVRMRKSGTDTSAVRVNLIYYTNISAGPEEPPEYVPTILGAHIAATQLFPGVLIWEGAITEGYIVEPTDHMDWLRNHEMEAIMADDSLPVLVADDNVWLRWLTQRHASRKVLVEEFLSETLEPDEWLVYIYSGTALLHWPLRVEGYGGSLTRQFESFEGTRVTGFGAVLAAAIAGTERVYWYISSGWPLFAIADVLPFFYARMGDEEAVGGGSDLIVLDYATGGYTGGVYAPAHGTVLGGVLDRVPSLLHQNDRDSARRFDGDAYIEWTNWVEGTGTTWCVAFLFTVPETHASDYGPILISRETSVESEPNYGGILYGAAGSLSGDQPSDNRFRYHDSANIGRSNTTALTPGETYHCALRVVAGEGTWYINGVADGTFSGAVSWNPYRTGWNGHIRYLEGVLDELILWRSGIPTIARLYEHYLQTQLPLPRTSAIFANMVGPTESNLGTESQAMLQPECRFELRIASGTIPDYRLDEPPVEPRLVERVPSITTQQGDPLYGIQRFGGGTIVHANGDWVYDKIAKTWNWHEDDDATAVVKLGGDQIDVTNYRMMTTLRGDEMYPSDDVADWPVNDVAGILSRNVLGRTFGQWATTEWGGMDPLANLMPDATRAKFMPRLFGTAWMQRAIPIVQTRGPMVQVIASGTSTTVFRSFKAGWQHDFTEAITVARAATGYTPENRTLVSQSTVVSAGVTLVVITVTPALGGIPVEGDFVTDQADLPEGQVSREIFKVADPDLNPMVEVVDVFAISKRDQAQKYLTMGVEWFPSNYYTSGGGYEEGEFEIYNGYCSDTYDIYLNMRVDRSLYLSDGSRTIELISDLLADAHYLGAPAGLSDEDIVRGLTTIPQFAGHYEVDGNVKVADLLDMFSRHVFIRVYQLPDGRFTWRQLGQESGADDPDVLVIGDEDIVDWKSVAPAWGHLQLVAAEYTQTDVGISSISVGVAGGKSVTTRIAAAAPMHAFDYCKLALFLYSRPTHAYTFRENGIRSMMLTAGDTLAVTRGRAVSSTGGYANNLLVANRIDKQLGDHPSVSLQAHDYWGLSDELKALQLQLPILIPFYLRTWVGDLPYVFTYRSRRATALSPDAGAYGILAPGEFNSAGPGASGAFQWDPVQELVPVAATTLATEIDDPTNIEPGANRPGWVIPLGGVRVSAGTWTVSLRLRASQGAGQTGRIFMRVSTVGTRSRYPWEAEGGYWYPPYAMFLPTNISGGAGGDGQEGWQASLEQITVGASDADYVVHFSGIEMSPQQWQWVLVELGAGDATTTTDRTWELVVNHQSTYVMPPPIYGDTVWGQIKILQLLEDGA